MTFLKNELITPEDAASLFLEFGTTDSVYRARDVYRACYAKSLNKYPGKEDSESVSALWALGAVYAAGRIQGIKEERAKHQKHTK